jgi:hypothetical protein
MAKRRKQARSGSFRDELEQRAARAILLRSFLRWESAAILGLTLILTVLLPRPLPFWQPWYWLILGAVGEIGLIWSSLTDPEFRAQAVAEMFREKFSLRQVADAGLKGQVQKALDYRDQIDEVIGTSREGVLRAHLEDVSGGITDWMENVFRLARRLDNYKANRTIHQDLKSVAPDIEKLKQRLRLEDNDAVKRQISQAIAQKQIQRDNLHKLENVMERAEFQLDSTITAMGTVYSQIMLLGSRDVASGRAQRLHQDIDDQVLALQDVVHTMDEVYRAGTDPLGLSTKELAALDAAAGGAQATGQRATGP